MGTSALILQLIFSGLTVGCVYAAAALGIYLCYVVTRVINFAQGEFLMLGGMIAATLYAVGVPLVGAVFSAVVITMLVGMLMYRVVIQPVSEAPPFALILLSMASSIVIRGIALIAWGTDNYSLPGFSGSKMIHIFGAVISFQMLWILGTLLFISVVLFLFLEYTVLGKALRACAVDRFAAGMVGINTKIMGLSIFAISASLGALMGVVMTPQVLTNYGVGLMFGIKGFLAALVGGLDRIEGVVAGGFAFGIVEVLAAGFISSSFKEIIALSVFVGILYFRRGGLFGGAEAGKV